jgi:phosphoribosylformylglycinamidine (FGAM) synthase-like enzyme
MTFASGMGCRIESPAAAAGRKDLALFGESGCRILIVFDEARTGEIEAAARNAGVPYRRLGATGGDRLTIVCGGETWIDQSVAALKDAWEATLPAIAHADLPEERRAAG